MGVSITDFGWGIIESIVASILVTLFAKITLEKWKEWFFGLGTTVVIAGIIAVLIFAGMTVTKQFAGYRERSALQEKVDTYLKGHYPDDYENGYRVDVAGIGERVLLALKYPNRDAYLKDHPWRNELFSSELQNLLNDNGYPGSPVWGYEAMPMTEDEIQFLLKRSKR